MTDEEKAFWQTIFESCHGMRRDKSQVCDWTALRVFCDWLGDHDHEWHEGLRTLAIYEKRPAYYHSSGSALWIKHDHKASTGHIGVGVPGPESPLAADDKHAELPMCWLSSLNQFDHDEAAKNKIFYTTRAVTEDIPNLPWHVFARAFQDAAKGWLRLTPEEKTTCKAQFILRSTFPTA